MVNRSPRVRLTKTHSDSFDSTRFIRQVPALSGPNSVYVTATLRTNNLGSRA